MAISCPAYMGSDGKTSITVTVMMQDSFRLLNKNCKPDLMTDSMDPLLHLFAEKRGNTIKRKSPAIRSKEITYRLCKALQECLTVTPTLTCVELQGLPLRDRDLTALAKVHNYGQIVLRGKCSRFRATLRYLQGHIVKFTGLLCYVYGKPFRDDVNYIYFSGE